MNQLTNLLDKIEASKDRTAFKVNIMRECGWYSDITFWRKKTGITPLTLKEIEIIRKIGKNYE
jgi:hypothetical protein